MPQSYYPELPDSVDDALDELLCEYVDGTMDPTVQAVFEEYLESNPDLAAHVRCLCDTRNMLCRVGAYRCASVSLQAQLRIKLANELVRKSRSSAAVWTRLGNAALLTSTVGLVLIVGMMAGLSTFQHTVVAGSQESTTGIDRPTTGMEILTDAHVYLGRTVPLEQLGSSNRGGFFGPVSVLPVVARNGYMTPIRWPYQGSDTLRSNYLVRDHEIAP
ncbi:MAG: hypothetical protein BMS9Abin05_2599 [Rhodothermia bacterium]|nr:MAG: hypothetical protein BMS9Abin05_2599 [Rhodothermia bacterium]